MEKFDFFDLKTDLADENDEIIRISRTLPDGIESSKRRDNGIDIFTMIVKTPQGEQISGKKTGKYVTVNVGCTGLYDTSTFEKTCTVFSNIIREFTSEIQQSGGSFLLAGLGNPHITADSVGAETVSSFIVTRHIKESSPDLFKKFGFSESSAIIPNVFGNTGVEAAEIIKGVVDDIKPSCVIAVDSLSSRRLSRLATTVQICDTGICPGSGVGNTRAEISSETIGVPVIAIGVPTVVNASTLISDVLSECGVREKDLSDSARKNIHSQVGIDCYVSPKDCGADIKSIARLIGYSLNAAIHNGIAFSEMRDFL
jgi:spore protease